MSELSVPSKTLAARILARADFDKRLVGIRLSPMAGSVEQPMHSLQDAARFLHIEPLDKVLAAGPKASVPYVDPRALQRWVTEVFGDRELGEAIGAKIEGGQNYRQRAEAIRALLASRMSQARTVLEDKPAGPPGPAPETPG